MAKINPSDEILQLLQLSPILFYLGGSRGMEIMETRSITDFDHLMRNGGYLIVTTPDTDYDFFTTFSQETLDFLLNNGFVHTVSSIGGFVNGYSYYMDDEAIAIVEKGNVQVVLRKDAVFYKRVFESITPEFYAKYLWKSSPYGVNREQIKPIFNALFAAARSQKGR